MIFLERTKEGHRPSDEHYNRFKGNVAETSEGRHAGYSTDLHMQLHGLLRLFLWAELSD